MAAAAAGALLLLPPPPSVPSKSLLQIQLPLKPTSKIPSFRRSTSKLFAAVAPRSPPAAAAAVSRGDGEERVFFDGGAHYGDLLANLLLGFTLLWLPLTLAAVSRAFFLRYRFTNRRVTVISGFTGQERSDFPYAAIADVKVVPRFIGEWGDIVITLKDGTKVDLRSVPKFREIADYCLFMADGAKGSEEERRGGGSRGFAEL